MPILAWERGHSGCNDQQASRASRVTVSLDHYDWPDRLTLLSGGKLAAPSGQAPARSRPMRASFPIQRTGIAYMVGMTLSKLPLKLIALRPDFFEAPVHLLGEDA